MNNADQTRDAVEHTSLSEASGSYGPIMQMLMMVALGFQIIAQFGAMLDDGLAYLELFFEFVAPYLYMILAFIGLMRLESEQTVAGTEPEQTAVDETETEERGDEDTKKDEVSKDDDTKRKDDGGRAQEVR